MHPKGQRMIILEEVLGQKVKGTEISIAEMSEKVAHKLTPC